MQAGIAKKAFLSTLRPLLSKPTTAQGLVARGFAKTAAGGDSKPGKTGKKVKKGKGKKGGQDEDDGSNLSFDGNAEELDHRQFDKFLNAAREASRTKLDWSEEEEKEHARIAKTYNINSFVRHQRLQKDMADKVWLMGEALAALPPALREAAEVIDEENPPADRPWAAWSTPPIKDFDSSPFEEADDDEDDDDENIINDAA